MCRTDCGRNRKSLKLFLGSFRNHGAFHEDCTLRSRKRLVAAINAEMAAHRRLLVSARRHADRRVLADRRAAEGSVAARPGRRALSRTRMNANADAIASRWPNARRRRTPRSPPRRNRAKGLLIVHTGPGKGKSTAAFGLVLRALGHGWRVGVVQFIKGAWDTGERPRFERFGDQSSGARMGEGFTWETQDRARDVAAARRAWDKALRLMADPAIRLLVLDELNIALRYDYLPLDEVVAALARAPRRPACRRHRPQRQAGADRGRRSRHRDDAGQAPFRGGREGAGGDRVLAGPLASAGASGYDRF